MGGMITSATSDLTMVPKAAPMMMPMAMSSTLPRMANSLNSFSISVPPTFLDMALLNALTPYACSITDLRMPNADSRSSRAKCFGTCDSPNKLLRFISTQTESFPTLEADLDSTKPRDIVEPAVRCETNAPPIKPMISDSLCALDLCHTNNLVNNP